MCPLRDRSSLTKPKLKLGEWRRAATRGRRDVPKALPFGNKWDQKEANGKKTSNQLALEDLRSPSEKSRDQGWNGENGPE